MTIAILFAIYKNVLYNTWAYIILGYQNVKYKLNYSEI